MEKVSCRQGLIVNDFHMRVLIIIHSFDSGIGIFLKGLLENFHDPKYFFTVVTLSENKWEAAKAVADTGVPVIEMKKFRNKVYQSMYRKQTIARMLKNSRWDVIYAHSSTVVMFPYLKMAKKYVNTRIMHSHARDFEGKYYHSRKIYHKIIKQFYPCVTTHNLACSEEAAAWMYPKSIIKNRKYQIIPNCIDVAAYKFERHTRERIRERYGLDGKFVIGHVGRFEKVKNHKFLVDVFAEICKKTDCAVLLLAGDGVLKASIEDYVREKRVAEKVLFLGKIDHANDIYQAIDFLMLPSEKEGFPIVLIEAQSSGIRCLVSDTVPDLVNCTGLVDFLSLNAPAGEWADHVMRSLTYDRRDRSSDVKKAGYDVSCLEKLYKGIFERDIP